MPFNGTTLPSVCPDQLGYPSGWLIQYIIIILFLIDKKIPIELADEEEE